MPLAGTNQRKLQRAKLLDSRRPLPSLNTIAGTGRLLVAPGTVVDLETGSTKDFFRVTENRGTVNWEDGTLSLSNSSSITGDRFINRSEGVFNAIGGGRISGFAGSDIAFVNDGTFTRSGGGTTEFGYSLVNTGMLEHVDGTLQFNVAGNSRTTALEVPDGARLNLRASFTYASPVAITGAGTINFTGGTHDFTGTEFLPTGRVNFRGGEIIIDNPFFPASHGRVTAKVTLNADHTFDSLVMDVGGELTGTGDITLTGNSTITAGTFDGTGRLLIAPGAVVDLVTNASKKLFRVTENRGTVNYEGTGVQLTDDLSLTGDGFINRPEGIFNAVGHGLFRFFSSSDRRFVNEGAFNRTAGGTMRLTVGLDNTGLVNHEAGRLQIVGTVTNSGSIEVHGGRVHLTAGVSNFRDGEAATVLEGGTWLLSTAEGSGAATLQIDGITPFAVNAADIVLDGENTQFTNQSDVDLLSDLREIASDASLTLDGGRDLTLSFGDFHNAGALRLGPGSTFMVIGNYTQSSTGRLETALGGPPNSFLFGRVVVAADAAFAGTLNVPLVDGFGPVTGDRFHVATYDSVSGGFDAIEGLLLNRVQVLEVSVDPTSTLVTGLADVTDLTVDSISLPLEATAGDDGRIGLLRRRPPLSLAGGLCGPEHAVCDLRSDRAGDRTL